ncbi:MAG: hypothetical protein PUF65_06875 [Lachnospiraceae bacterium]|nr:hypothetical protein [Lachnospiraceae bacterium]
MANILIADDEKEIVRLNERNMLYSCIAHDLKTPMTLFTARAVI